MKWYIRAWQHLLEKLLILEVELGQLKIVFTGGASHTVVPLVFEKLGFSMKGEIYSGQACERALVWSSYP